MLINVMLMKKKHVNNLTIIAKTEISIASFLVYEGETATIESMLTLGIVNVGPKLVLK